MLTCNRVTLKGAGGFTARPAAVAVLSNGFVATLIIKSLDTALVWPGCEQSERK